MKKIDYEKFIDLLFQLHIINTNFKMIPIILFCILYIFSGIDLIPEAIFSFWYSYLDDIAVLITINIYIYCSLRGIIHEKEYTKIDRNESLYSYITRNTSQHFDNNSVIKNNDNSFDSTDSDSYMDVHNIYFENEQVVWESKEDLLDKTKRHDSESLHIKRSKKEERTDSSFKIRTDRKSSEELSELYETENRPEKFQIEYGEIIW